MVGEVSGGGGSDEGLEFLLESGRGIFCGEVGVLFFAVEDDGEEDEEPEGAEDDDEGLVAAELFWGDGLGVGGFWQGVERVLGGDFEGGGEVLDGSFRIGVAEEVGEWVGAGVEAVDFEVVAVAIGGGLGLEDADDEGGVAVLAGDDFDF